jgi:serine/threonine protein kinase
VPPKPSKEDASVHKFRTELERQFGPLLMKVGVGDSGTVYKVRRSGCSETRYYALKVPNSSARSALKQEYDKAMMLPPHENLIQYLEIIQEGSGQVTPFSFLPPDGVDAMDLDMPAPSIMSPAVHKPSFAVLLEFAAGGSLQDRLDQGKALTEDELRPLVRDILEGLHHIHEQQFMHLDIKPANIFLHRAEGPAMIGDFGKMKMYSEYSEGNEGDSTYMAPEVMMDGYQPPVHSPDIFSLGVTILECATDLEIPKSGQGEGWRLLRQNACPQEFLNPLSPELQNMVLKMLQQKPELRPTAEELLREPWFDSLPLVTSAQKPRKSRSTSSPSTPFNFTATHHMIASSAPSHHYMPSNRFAQQYQTIRGIGPYSATTSAVQQPVSTYEPTVARRINFSTEN